MKAKEQNFQNTLRKLHIEIFLLLAADMVSFSLAFGFVLIIQLIFFPDTIIVSSDEKLLQTIVIILFSSFVILASRGLYPGWRRSSIVELKQIVEAITLVYIIICAIFFIQGRMIDYALSAFILSWFFVIFILPTNRFLCRKLIARFPWWGEPVVIIGLENEVVEMAVRLTGCKRLGLRPVIGLGINSKNKTESYQFSILPWSVENQNFVKNMGVRTNVLAISANELHCNYPDAFKHLELSFKKTVFILDKNIYGGMMAEPVDIAGQPAIISTQSLLDPSTRLIKKIVEILLSIILCIPILLVGGFIAILIKIDSPGPIFYFQERIGLNRKPFKLIKFRTMKSNSDEELGSILKNAEVKQEWEIHHKLSKDPRITRVGKWVRRFSLDELPQFINILRGEMTLIGPRPLIKAEIDDIGETATTILQIRPGLTGWWQVMGRNALSFEERTRLDLFYVFNWSLWLDMFIFIKTFMVIFIN